MWDVSNTAQRRKIVHDMLCEDCQQRAATVHVTVVSWGAAEASRHLCERCYPAEEAVRAKSRITPVTPPPANVEHVTGEEFHRLMVRARANVGADRPAFDYVCRELNKFPNTRARLALELLRMACQSLEDGNNPRDLICYGGCFGKPLETIKVQEYVRLLERIVVLSFARVMESTKPLSHHPFGFGLRSAVARLRHADSERCAAVLARLADPTGEEAERRRLITEYVRQR